MLEGINSLIQASKRRARGYRTRANLIAMTYLIAGKLDMGYLRSGRRAVSAISAFVYACPSIPQPPSGASLMSTHVRSASPGSPAAAATISVISLTTPSFFAVDDHMNTGAFRDPAGNVFGVYQHRDH